MRAWNEAHDRYALISPGDVLVCTAHVILYDVISEAGFNGLGIPPGELLIITSLGQGPIVTFVWSGGQVCTRYMDTQASRLQHVC